MKDTYLMDVVRGMSSEELKEFQLFLESPYFNRGSMSQELILLFEVIASAFPGFDETLLDKKAVYDQVFRNKGFIDGKLEKLMSELTRLLRVFAVVHRKTGGNQQAEFQFEWLEWLRERGLKDRYFQSLSKFRNNFGRSSQESLPLYKVLYQLAESEYTWHATYNFLKGDLNIPDYLRHLDLFYLNLRGDLTLRYHIQRKAAQLTPPENLLVFEDPGRLPEYYAGQSPLLDLNQRFNQLINQEQPRMEDFRQIVALLQSIAPHLTEDTLSLYYSHLRNYCTLLIDDGHLELIQTLHDLNQSNLQDGYFFNNGKLRFNAYISLVQIAIRAKDIEWAYSFTEQYKSNLVKSEWGEFYYKLNLASCMLASGEADAALDQLPETSPSLVYQLIVKRLELKAYYELNSDLLPYKIDAFRKFVERTAPKSVSANLQKMNINFVHMLVQLYQSPFRDKQRAEKLKARISSKKLICERSWLLEKAGKLE